MLKSNTKTTANTTFKCTLKLKLFFKNWINLCIYQNQELFIYLDTVDLCCKRFKSNSLISLTNRPPPILGRNWLYSGLFSTSCNTHTDSVKLAVYKPTDWQKQQIQRTCQQCQINSLCAKVNHKSHHAQNILYVDITLTPI